MDHDHFDYSGPSCHIGGLFVAKLGVTSLSQRLLQQLVYGPYVGLCPQTFQVMVHYHSIYILE
jgi:hypothetical protein